MTSLTERAMLLQLSVHLPQKSKRDRDLSAETPAAHGVADAEMGKFTKSLFAKHAVASLQSAARPRCAYSGKLRRCLGSKTTVRAQPHGWPVSALCGRSLMTRRMGENAPHRPLVGSCRSARCDSAPKILWLFMLSQRPTLASGRSGL